LIGCYKRLNDAMNAKYAFVAFDGTNAIFLEERDNLDRNFSGFNRTAATTNIVTSEPRGAWSIYRYGNTQAAILNQGSAATASNTSTGATNAEVWFGAFHTNGTLDSGFESSNEFAAEWQSIEIVWTADEVRLLHREIRQLLRAFGAAV
jgi:hypothetical protein